VILDRLEDLRVCIPKTQTTGHQHPGWKWTERL